MERELEKKYEKVISQYELLIKEQEENDKLWEERKKIVNYLLGRE